MFVVLVLAQAPPPAPAQPISAATVFYVTLLFIFLTAIITTVVNETAIVGMRSILWVFNF